MIKKTTIYVVLAVLCQKKPKAKRPKPKAYVLITLLLCLFRSKDQRLKTKDYQAKWLLCCMLVLICCSGTTMAQTGFNKTTPSSDKAVASPLPLGEGKGGAPLRVGDKLPETFWQQEHTIYANGKITKETLVQYKGKLLILDFWATWCGSCIKKFPLSDSLERTDPNVKVMLVNTSATKDTPEKISTTLSNYGPNLETVMNDTLLSQYFPQVQLPHYVWIENGQVRAITGSEFFNRANVLNALQRRQQLNETIQKRNAKKP